VVDGGLRKLSSKSELKLASSSTQCSLLKGRGERGCVVMCSSLVRPPRFRAKAGIQAVAICLALKGGVNIRVLC
jgi:hypothetical protein